MSALNAGFWLFLFILIKIIDYVKISGNNRQISVSEGYLFERIMRMIQSIACVDRKGKLSGTGDSFNGNLSQNRF